MPPRKRKAPTKTATATSKRQRGPASKKGWTGPGRGGQGGGAAEDDVVVVDVDLVHATEVRLQTLFETFADPEDKEVMDMDGISRLCQELGLDASEDVRALVLLWKLGARAKPGELAKAEFDSGMRSMGADSLEQLKRSVPALDPGFMDHKTFRDFYRFCFLFNREGTHKTLEKDLVVALLPLVMGNRSPFTTRFLDFLASAASSSTTRITSDQWNSFFEFSLTVGADLEGYEEDAAWPVLIDEFVEWCRAPPTADGAIAGHGK